MLLPELIEGETEGDDEEEVGVGVWVVDVVDPASYAATALPREVVVPSTSIIAFVVSDEDVEASVNFLCSRRVVDGADDGVRDDGEEFGVFRASRVFKVLLVLVLMSSSLLLLLLLLSIEEGAMEVGATGRMVISVEVWNDCKDCGVFILLTAPLPGLLLL